MSEKLGLKDVPELHVGAKFWVGHWDGVAYVTVISDLSETHFGSTVAKFKVKCARGESFIIFPGDLGYPEFAYDNRPNCIKHTKEAAAQAYIEMKAWLSHY